MTERIDAVPMPGLLWRCGVGSRSVTDSGPLGNTFIVACTSLQHLMVLGTSQCVFHAVFQYFGVFVQVYLSKVQETPLAFFHRGFSEHSKKNPNPNPQDVFFYC